MEDGGLCGAEKVGVDVLKVLCRVPRNEAIDSTQNTPSTPLICKGSTTS